MIQKLEGFIAFGIYLYIMAPLMFDGYNKLITKRTFFLINYAVAVLLLLIYLILVKYKTVFGDSNLICIMAAPFLFLNLYKAFEWIIAKIYERQFILTNRYMSKTKWKFNFLDQIFTILAVFGSIGLPFFFHKLLLYVL